jgi:SAM-dependent methyltransferase
MSEPVDNRPPPTDFERSWRVRFEEFARNNDADAGIAGWSETGLATRLGRFAELFDASGAVPGSRWLDVGCGAGTYSQFLCSRDLDVVGLDYSLPALVKAQNRYDPRIRWAAADAKRLPVASGWADGLLCFGVVQALAESRSLVHELRRVVRPGGHVWLDALNGWCLPHITETLRRKARGKPLHVRYESPARMQTLLREAGFVDIRRIWLPIVPARFHRVQRLLDQRWMRGLVQTVLPLGASLSHSVLWHARVPQGRQGERP